MARQIPPIHCLETFEALARLRSASRAAEELCVTPSAVSHRIRQLEAVLGVPLFERGGFSPTEAGAAYLLRVQQGLQALRRLPDANGQRPAPCIRLATTPTFSRQMLLPRLALFRHAYPEIELVLQVAIPLLNIKAEDADLEIRFGTGSYRDVEHVRVLSDDVCPVACSDIINECGPFEGFESAAAVGRVRLIRSPIDPWSIWFRAFDIELPEPQGGPQFNDAGLACDAAAAGFGVALMRLRLGAAWLTDGRLVRLSSRSVPSPHHHFLCWKPGTLQRWECAAFVDWLRHSLG